MSSRNYGHTPFELYKLGNETLETLTCSIPNCSELAVTLGYCRPHYSRHAQPLTESRNTELFQSAPPVRKLADKSLWFLKQLQLQLDWPEECVAWPWAEDGRRHTMNFQGSGKPVTHVVLHFYEGPRPSAQHQGLHSCDTQWCINARHLRWGLELENRLDQVARSRGDIGRIGLDVAREVRAELEEISVRRGVPLDAIARIAGGKTWTDESWETN